MLIFGKSFSFILFNNLNILYFFVFVFKNVSIEGVAELKIILQLEFFALTTPKSLKLRINLVVCL